ncbi:MerR family transcriptional regulator [Lentzea sp. NPDC004782]|uniref:MerR family transcriptional regulator n=1 Tax=Lentzea sp. NPDC004782 TaxID=3154458 RepID=UPI0033A8B421
MVCRKVAELARQVGVRPDTVRYYERAGLLAPPPRTSSGYRQYPDSAAERIRFVRDCQRLGLRLREISSLPGLVDLVGTDCPPWCPPERR